MSRRLARVYDAAGSAVAIRTLSAGRTEWRAWSLEWRHLRPRGRRRRRAPQPPRSGCRPASRARSSAPAAMPVEFAALRRRPCSSATRSSPPPAISRPASSSMPSRWSGPPDERHRHRPRGAQRHGSGARAGAARASRSRPWARASAASRSTRPAGSPYPRFATSCRDRRRWSTSIFALRGAAAYEAFARALSDGEPAPSRPAIQPDPWRSVGPGRADPAGTTEPDRPDGAAR